MATGGLRWPTAAAVFGLPWRAEWDALDREEQVSGAQFADRHSVISSAVTTPTPPPPWTPEKVPRDAGEPTRSSRCVVAQATTIQSEDVRSG
jgi:hypothetical protein